MKPIIYNLIGSIYDAFIKSSSMRHDNVARDHSESMRESELSKFSQPAPCDGVLTSVYTNMSDLSTYTRFGNNNYTSPSILLGIWAPRPSVSLLASILIDYPVMYEYLYCIVIIFNSLPSWSVGFRLHRLQRERNG
jgi:hypothetical protein